MALLHVTSMPLALVARYPESWMTIKLVYMLLNQTSPLMTVWDVVAMSNCQKVLNAYS